MRTSRFWQGAQYVVFGTLGMGLTTWIMLSITHRLSKGSKRFGPAAQQPASKQSLSQAARQDVISTHRVRQAYLETQVLDSSEASMLATDGKRQGRAWTIVGVALLLVVILGTFLYSGHIFASVLSQSGGHSTGATQQAQLLRPAFERGIIYPQWSPAAYGTQDTLWQQALGPIKQQTGAQWIEIPVLFSQATNSSTTVTTDPSTPQISSFVEGIQRAHSLGYKVFFVPLMQVRQPGMWSGTIAFSSEQQEQAWFDGYWQAIEPYVAAAAAQHVEQMAIGTELQTLQQTVPDALWNGLITRIRTVFSNTLTYDMNWSSLGRPMPNWLENPALTYIGVSTYIPLLNSPGHVDPSAIPALWGAVIKSQLDGLAAQLQKPVLITEIGYRDSADALYQTWLATSKAPDDPQEQAGAYEAALSNVFSDTLIAGTFFWGWDNVGMFAIKNQPAVQVLLKWYSKKATRSS